MLVDLRLTTVVGLVVGLVLLALPVGATTANDTSVASPLDAAVGQLESGDLGGAERALRALIGRQDSPAARDLLGVVLSRQGRLGEAEQQFEQALTMDADFLDGRQHLARLYLLQKRRNAAVEQLRRAARLGPLERDLAMTLASIELSAGNTAAAERQLRSVAGRFGSVQALLRLSRIAAARQDVQGSLDALGQALEIAPASEEVLAANARTSLTAGLPVPAITVLEPLTRMHPTVAEYAYLMGVAQMQVGDMAGSIESLQRSLDLEPDRAAALIGLGSVLNQQKRYVEAKETLNRSLVLDPDNVDGLAALAEAEAGLSRFEAAEDYAQRALAEEPAHATASLALGTIRMQEGRYDEAREVLEATVAADPQSARAHYQLSLANSRLGDRDKSRHHVEIYRRLLREDEERLVDLRRKLGLPDNGGTAP
ncbi:MAG: tetratricopeptide repeat protein [Acidobacteriota bacterium]